MRCIYCLEDSSDTRGRAHVVPEGIAKNDLVLPLGTVCDSCNSYLGHELDAALISHPVIALHAQVLGLPGKGAKPRARIGNVERDVKPNSISIPCAEPVITFQPDGSREATATTLVPLNFSLSRFRRALYHVALNAVAYQDGVERAHDSLFDPARKYVRAPGKAERRPFVQYVNLSAGIAPRFMLMFAREEGAEIIALGLTGNTILAVDLVDSGHLLRWGKRELPASHSFVEEADDVPREPKRGDGKQFRLTIELDGWEPGQRLA